MQIYKNIALNIEQVHGLQAKRQIKLLQKGLQKSDNSKNRNNTDVAAVNSLTQKQKSKVDKSRQRTKKHTLKQEDRYDRYDRKTKQKIHLKKTKQ